MKTKRAGCARDSAWDIAQARSNGGLRIIIGSFTAAVFVLLFAGCEQQGNEIIDAGNSTAIVDSPADATSAQQSAVCDPFSDSSHAGADLSHGIVGSLFYLDSQHRHYFNVADYQRNGTLADTTIFMNNFDVMTRPFDRGFVAQDGTVLKDADGNTLYEYFSFHFETTLQLTNADPEGEYQFALLADDGAVMQADAGNGFETIVDDDGTHPTKMGCSTKTVTLHHGQGVPLTVDYYQGPRYHIALVLMWRPVPAGKNAAPYNDPDCGKNGNGRFFDYSKTPSQPTKTYQGLLDRGWRVISSDNFNLPSSVTANPCTKAVPVTTTISGSTPAAGALTSLSTMTVNFLSNYPDATFECSLDQSAFASCVSPLVIDGLSAGAHHFEVYAIDPNGHADPNPQILDWTVQPVTTSITSVSYDAPYTNLTSMTFTFASDYADANFDCSLDGAAWAPCVSPATYSGLVDGNHSFSVRAIDSSGSIDPSPPGYSWTVDTRAPRVVSLSTTSVTTSVIINWTTNELATTALTWGIGTVRDNIIPDDGTYVLSHSATLNNLLPDTIYTMVIGGHDQAGNTIMPTVRGFLTAP